jgi:hypothetical protein
MMLEVWPPDRSAARSVAGDELIGNVTEVIADDLRLRTNSQEIIAFALDQSSFPTGRHRAERVPGMTGDHAELRRADGERLLDMGVGLGRRFEELDAIHAEASFEEIGDPALRQLSALNPTRLLVRVNRRKPAPRSFRSAAGTSA